MLEYRLQAARGADRLKPELRAPRGGVCPALPCGPEIYVDDFLLFAEDCRAARTWGEAARELLPHPLKC